jgi:hypothetical protein
MEIQTFHQGLFLIDAPAQKNSIKVVESGCIGAVNLRHLASRLRQGRKEAERLDAQVSPTLSA